MRLRLYAALLIPLCGLPAAGAAATPSALVLIAAVLVSTGPARAAGGNIAWRGPYQCFPAPDYWGWKGPQHGDRGQLADGVVTEPWVDGAGREFYALPSVAGWTSVDPVVIVCDLGADRPVCGVRLHSVLSPWGPWWPGEIAVTVSDDGKLFRLAQEAFRPRPSDLTPALTEDVVQAAVDRVMADKGLAPSTHWLTLEGLQTHGRYLGLILHPHASTATIVLDEIEIIAGRPELMRTGRPARALREGPGGRESYLLGRALDERFTRDAAALQAKIKRSRLAAARQARLVGLLDQLRLRRRDMSVPAVAGFRAVLPVDDLHRDLFAVQAQFWQAQGAPALRVWTPHRWDPLTPLDDPAGGRPRLDILMAANEARSGAVNLTSADSGARSVALCVSGISPAAVEWFEVLTVDTKSFAPVTSALVPAREARGGLRVTVPAGMTRQVWLRVSSRYLEVGQHLGAVIVESPGKPSMTVPLRVEVLPVRLPESFTLRVGGWDYALDESYEVTSANRDELVRVLREYGVNTPWANGDVLPHGTYDADGNLTAPPARDRMERWLALWPDASLYCVMATGANLPADVSLRERKIAAWARDWADYLTSRGVSPSRLAILVRDEPTTEAELAEILTVGRAIKRGAPEVKVWNDLHFADPAAAPPSLDAVMREACDVQCVNRQHYQSAPEANAAFMDKYRRPGLEWWTYTGGAHGRTTDPYVGWVLQSWFAFARGLRGTHAWAFGDGGGGSSWCEALNPRPAGTPLYLTPECVTTSKSMEALREGLQDHEILRLLQDAVDRGGAAPAEARSRGRQVLATGVGEVLAVDDQRHWPWCVPKDRATADRVRAQALRALSAR